MSFFRFYDGKERREVEDLTSGEMLKLYSSRMYCAYKEAVRPKDLSKDLTSLRSVIDVLTKRLETLKTELNTACTHPEDDLLVRSHTSSDTLGNNSHTEYQLHCRCCNKGLLRFE